VKCLNLAWSLGLRQIFLGWLKAIMSMGSLIKNVWSKLQLNETSEHFLGVRALMNVIFA